MKIFASCEDIDKLIDGYFAQLLPDALIRSDVSLGEEVKRTVAKAVRGM